MFPSLVNCCTIDWFVKWPPEALFSVALGSLQSIAESDEQCEQLAQICVSIHESVEATSKNYYDEMRRYYYTTPSSYLELLKQYHELLDNRNKTIFAKRDRIATGLNKLLETNKLVSVMEEELQKLVPVLEEQSRNMKELLAKLDKDNAMADVVKKSVMKDEAEAKIKASLTQEIADDAERDLELAMPAFRTAQDALKAINKNDVTELRVFQRPPRLVQFVMESVCILLGAKYDVASMF
jgi:dynein heavy chain, axonemal